MKKLGVCILLAVIIGLSALAYWTVEFVNADDGDSGSGGDLGNTCTHYCTSWGAGWHYQDLATFQSWPYDSSSTGASASIKAEIVNRCSSTPGVYRLSFERSNTRGSSFVAGQFSGLVDVNRNVPYISSIAEDWNAVYSYFLIAEDHGVTSTEWGDTAWFCYDPDWNPPTPDPEPEPEPEPGSGDAYFYSTSTATVSGVSDAPYLTVTTDPDGESEIKFSTDQASVDINFSHSIYYVNDGEYDDDDEFPDVSTEWRVSSSGEATPNHSASGTYTTNGKSSNNSVVDPSSEPGASNPTNTVTVTLAAGQTKTICQTIKYNPKYITFDSEPVDDDNDGDTDYYEYSIDEKSGNEDSKVCVEVTRPADPTGGPYSTSTMDSTLMYAGEDATIGWDILAASVPTRRLSAWQAIVYQVPSSAQYYEGITTGTTRHRGNGACGYYAGRTNPTYRNCGIYDKQEGSLSYGAIYAHHEYEKEYKTVVPDHVGDKYCNSFGHFYQYWYYISNGDNAGWHHDSSRDYWVIYNAACRTIAKKPSTSVWNGSLKTGNIDSGVLSSLSYRYVPATMGEVANNQPRYLYGSWAEYLAVVNGSIVLNNNKDGFASGAALAGKLGSQNREMYDNSPLTIANQGAIANRDSSILGYSGVHSNSTQRIRLETFLKNNAAAYDIGGAIGGSDWTDLTKTRIVRRSGVLNITDNVTISTGPYNSIYQIPQVIIFVDGDVNITSNVTQIDAWIIATGTINTCATVGSQAGFEVGITEADAIGAGNSQNPGNSCTNQLVFNGPVMAGNLELKRSFGSDPLIYYRTGTFGAPSDRQTSAEVFNYRADAYLWAYAQASRYDSSFTETYTRELAPRY